MLRNRLFWMLDLLKGGPLHKDLTEVSKIQEAPFSETSVDLKNRHLSALLKHARTTVPYYKELSAGTLNDFPVIRKEQIQAHFDSFRSSDFLNNSLYRVATSGSTGAPFILYQDKRKRRRNTADVLHFMQRTGYRPGDSFVHLAIWKSHNVRSSWYNRLQNTLRFDATKLTGPEISNLLSEIRRKGEDTYLLGLASALESICKYLNQHPEIDPPRLKAVIAYAEYLTEDTRRELQKHFKAEVYARYSNEEAGILAQQITSDNGGFRLNWSGYHFELLDLHEDKPVQPGEKGRIVVTDLFNYAMPLIRYDTEDIGIAANSSLLDLRSVEGRILDLVYNTEGELISSYIIYTFFYPYFEQLNQYQFIQVSRDSYTIKLNCNGFFSYEEKLKQEVYDVFGKKARIQIEYVNDIPRLKSGKYKKVVNLYR